MTKNTELAEKLPWVKRLTKKPVPCEAKCRGKKHRPCKNLAWWRFTALRSSWAKTGNYCWSHLLHRGLYGDMEEMARTDKWLDENG